MLGTTLLEKLWTVWILLTFPDKVVFGNLMFRFRLPICYVFGCLVFGIRLPGAWYSVTWCLVFGRLVFVIRWPSVWYSVA